MAATCTVNRLLGANALPIIDIARAGMGTWIGSAGYRESNHISLYQHTRTYGT